MRILDTERTEIRRLLPDDAPFMLELLNDPSFIRNIGDRGIRDLEGARGYIMRSAVASHEKHGYGLDLVQLKMTAVPAGICGLVRRDYLDDPDIGFAFLPRFTGLGYAVESATAVIEHARKVLNLPRVLAIVSPDNARSIRVLERIGLRYERMITPPGDSEPIRLFTSDA